MVGTLLVACTCTLVQLTSSQLEMSSSNTTPLFLHLSIDTMLTFPLICGQRAGVGVLDWMDGAAARRRWRRRWWRRLVAMAAEQAGR
jgi:hypothetical protein